MESWMLVPIVVLVLGGAVITYGALRDRTRRAEEQEALTSAPDRSIPGLSGDVGSPTYLDPAAARRSTSAPAVEPDPAEIERLAERLGATDPLLRAGWAHEGFVSRPDQGWAMADDARVLVVDGPLDDPRLAVALIDRARRLDRPLVIIADRFASSVIEVLEINTVRGTVRLNAVTADVDARRRAVEATGGVLVEVTDLQAGYLPDDHLGRAARWISDEHTSWVLDDTDAEPRADDALS